MHKKTTQLPLAPPVKPIPSPIRPETWQRITDELGLCRQQARVADLILKNHGDKQIAAAMGLKVPTIRTYMDRIFRRTGVGDRMELVLKIFSLAMTIEQQQREKG